MTIAMGDSSPQNTAVSQQQQKQQLQDVARRCGCEIEDLEDVYACTPLQEGMFSLTLKDSGAYNVAYKYRLPPDVNPHRLRAAWEKTAQANPILRTRIVPTSDRGCVQAVLRKSIPWIEKGSSQDEDVSVAVKGDSSTNDESVEARLRTIWPVGSPMAKLVWDSTNHDLTIVLHHALCDDWSMSVVLRQVAAAYAGEALAMKPFRPLIDFIENTESRALRFWEKRFYRFDHANTSIFPSRPSQDYVPQPTTTLRRTFSQPAGARAPFALNAKVRVAWAILQSLYTRSSEVLFGAIDTGRGIPLSGIEELSGPALACIPVHVRLGETRTVTEALDLVQREWIESMEFEHAGLQNIMRMGPGPAAACRFQALLAVEPSDSYDLPDLFLQQQSLQPVFDTYSLIIRWRPNAQSQSVTIEATFDAEVLDTQQVERILHQFAHIYQQIDSTPQLALDELDVSSPEDIRDLKHWNFPIPAVVRHGVHELIAQQAQKTPQAVAVCGWDGSFTYDELDTSSSALADVLAGQGVCRGTVVPVCVGHSKWAAVAMMAVMKSGAAFVLLDESYPLARLQKMCEDVQARLVVGTGRTSNLASQLELELIAVDELNWGALSPEQLSSSFDRSIRPEDVMYITFTSGSTGVPKGVIVSHGGFATSATAHAPLYNFTPSARVLQFASPGFDSYIIENLSTLVGGGCVCVPHPDDCRSRLESVINEFAVNNACLTPTVARILSPDILPTLQDLSFIGEAVNASDVARLESFVRVRNAYGPAECSAVFAVQPHLTPHDPSNIGFATGGVGWVVDPDDPQRLMPVGSIGELIIEGPIVGLGYTSDAAASKRAFIDPPRWRQKRFGACSGRMYRTGDLVQSAGDGSFRYLGRKDTQVKLRGQRIELGEIEHHLKRSALPGSAHVVADIVDFGGQNGDASARQLVAFICWPDSASRAEEERLPGTVFLEANEDHRNACAAAEARLSSSLPSFMVPRTFISVHHMPQTFSGKLDRRQLREQAAQLSSQQLEFYRVSQVPQREPGNSTEAHVQQIWAQVLNIPKTRVGVSQSFFHLGGDSVSAMQVAASCQREGYPVGVTNIFQSPTVEELAEHIIQTERRYSSSTSSDSRLSSGSTPITSDDDDDAGDRIWTGLSPVQQMLFDLCPKGHDRFTQQFLLQISKPQPASRLREAIDVIVQRHPILGAVFEQRAGGGWRQLVGEEKRPQFYFREHVLPGIGDGKLREVLEESQDLLDIKAGRLFVVDLINTPAETQYISLMIHHLVIDLVSWRALLQELEEYLVTGALSGQTPMTFHRWCQLQESFARRCLDPETALPAEIPPQPLDYWGEVALAEGKNTWADTIQESFTVPEDITRQILGSANDALRTRPVELLNAALVYSFARVFDDRQAPTLFTEGHGREPWDLALDLSRTVGWFTTMMPVFVHATRDNDLGTVIQRVKDGRRAIPSNGWAYFASRFLHPRGRERWRDHLPMEILFNYTGLFQQFENPDALLQLAAVPDHEILPMPADLPRFALIDVSVTVVNGCLSASIMYNRQMRHQDKLHEWVIEYQRALEELPAALKEYKRFTLSDFPLLSLESTEQLDGLIQEVQERCQIKTSNIEDIYPCSPVQLGMWLSQSKDPQAYWSRLRWSVRSTPPGENAVSLSRLQEAWQQVVRRHPILRTILVASPRMDGQPLQIVLRRATADFSEQPLQTTEDPDENSLSIVGEYAETPRLGHYFRARKISDSEAICDLIINHILIDGFTLQILLSDLQCAYDGQLPSFGAAPFSRYLTSLRGQSEQSARAYWKKYLRDVQPCLFPRLDGSIQGPGSTLKSVPFSMDASETESLQSLCQGHGTTVANILQVAWGLVLRAYTGSDSVCFGYLASARDVPLPGVQEIAGPLINLLVCKLNLEQDDDVRSVIASSQTAYAQSLDHRYCSLPEVIHALGLTIPRLFNTAMSLQKERDQPVGTSSSVVVEQQGGQDVTEYDLTVNITVRKASIEGDLTFSSHLMSRDQATMIADSFTYIVKQITAGQARAIGKLDFFSPMNKNKIWDINKNVPAAVNGCIHSTIQRHSLARPTSPAVTAGNGTLTYAQLDGLASNLALQLCESGVSPDVFVPICCEKSSWVVIAVLAVLKAGGAFILLDPAHPVDRLQAVIKKDFPKSLVLTTRSAAPVAAKIGDDVLVVDTEDPSGVDTVNWPSFPAVNSPASAAYAVYTSGSTGTPKASVIGHRSYLTAAAAHTKVFGLGPASRVLQFASFAFDASIAEILSTLLVGGCICIPSEEDRTQNLAHFIQKYQVNWALLTPSVSRILDPEEISSLKTLVLGGEEVRAADVQRWSSHVALMNAYGPSECSVIATVQTSSNILAASPSNIGYPTGGLTWVVDTQECARPVPIGALGELFIEGPIVGRGYVNRPEQDAAAFILNPQWIDKKHRNGSSRFYKTGDLARMLPDGSLRYEGRKDRQVKLHGQRMELSEVERHVRDCFPGIREVFAELVKVDGAAEPRLVACIQQQVESQTEFDDLADRARDVLRKRIPAFLIPSSFIRLEDVPTLPSGKVDRLQLRRNAAVAIHEAQAGKPNVNGRLSRDVGRDLTAGEKKLRELWAELLHIAPEKIFPDDNFFSLGGDSILVMKLASVASRQGSQLTVADVFLHPQLDDLARFLEDNGRLSSVAGDATMESDPTPFSLLPSEKHLVIKRQAVAQCGVSMDRIEDIYPATAMQAGLAAMSAERPGAYVAHHVFQLQSDIDLDRLRQAWDSVVKRHPILRTRLIQATDLGCLQVVIKDGPVQWTNLSVQSPEATPQQLGQLPDPSRDGIFGVPLVYFTVWKAQDGNGKVTDCTLTVTMHHAVYDAWSLPRLLEDAERIYHNGGPALNTEPAPFQRYIQYTSSQNKTALDRWEEQLRTLTAEPFPSLPFQSYRPVATSQLDYAVTTGPFAIPAVTRTTAVRLAWGLVQSQYQSHNEVVFGVISSGRSAPVPDLQNMTGPTITAMPLRIQIDPHEEIQDTLNAVQKWVTEMVPFEHLGLQQIARRGPDGVRACSFQTLLNIEQADDSATEKTETLFRSVDTAAEQGAFATYAVVLNCTLELDTVRISATFDNKVIPEWKMQRILYQFGHILELIHQQTERSLGDMIASLNAEDLKLLQEWSSSSPNSISESVPSAIQRQTVSHPDAPAICAWDGGFTYLDLEVWSSRLANVLNAQNIQPGSFVPLYMDRSRWVIVAMLGIIKAGAAFVLLDTSYPLSRLQTICEEVNAQIVLTSPDRVSAAQDLAPKARIIPVGECIQGNSQHFDTPLDKTALRPKDALYAMFTSGSTGKPKGVVIEHGPFVTMSKEYRQRVGLGPGARVLHFGSYAFDVTILETLCTLIAGGCICIPSEPERQEKFTEALRRLQPTHALLTPSFVRALPVDELAPIHTLMLVGEPPRRDEIEKWSSAIRLMNLYGPAECTILAALQPRVHPTMEPTNIGFTTAGTPWIADPRDPHHPVPIGAVGELLLQGPMVGRCYLNEPEITMAAFLRAPAWITRSSRKADPSNERVYRTGDLVRYEHDGSLVYLGRKDFQVKLRGQRLELSEVEDHILRAFPGYLKDVAAELVTPADSHSNPSLVAFLSPSEIQGVISSSSFPLPVASSADFQQKVNTARSLMCERVPDFMVPAIFVPLVDLPRTIGGKIDRRRLREAAGSVTRQQLEAVGSTSQKQKAPMSSTVERTLHNIWAKALGVSPVDIGAEDSFFRLGGDSITALQATSQARAVAIEHSVADLFRWKTIREIGRRFANASGDDTTSGISEDIEAVLPVDTDGAGVFPCTPVQRGVLLTQIKDPSSYAPHFIWKIEAISPSQGTAVEVDRLVAAWRQVVARHSALRSVFRHDAIDEKEMFRLQILPEIEVPIHILPTSNADARGVPTCLTQIHPQITGHDGQIPHQFTICPGSKGEIYCRLDINHAIIDAISVALLERDLLRIYDEGTQAPESRDAYEEYLRFVHRQPLEPAAAYWREYLAGMQPSVLPQPKAAEIVPSIPQRLEIPITCTAADIDKVCQGTDWTASNLLYFAWALTLSCFTGSDDICFGTLTSGRHIPIPHIEETVGQISNMAVCRVSVPPDRDLDEVALALQEDYGHVLMYQSFPLSEMARASGLTVQELASTAINVQYALADASNQEKSSLSLTPVTGLDPTLQDVLLYALVDPQGEVRASMTYREAAISTELATQLGDYFAHFVSTIIHSPHSTVQDLLGLSVNDRQRLQNWNAPLSPPPPACVHELIAKQAREHPSSLAISGWDGDFTYQDLEQAATRLAALLVARGVTPSQYVPICSEKSRWTTVAMLAVMKAGATFVPLDASHPSTRLRELCQRVNASHIISSIAQADACANLAENVIVLGDSLDQAGIDPADAEFTPLPSDPHQPAYILFTSGTTGTPKGVMVPHSSYIAAAAKQIEAFDIGPGSCVLQFSSYAFDVAVMEILTTLLAGATIGVLSDNQRNEMLLNGLGPFPVTHAFLTPSVAATLDADRSWVKTLVLLGEPMSAAHIDQWGDKCHLMNAYGPTECAVLNTARANIVPGCDPGNMGHALGVHFWVVDQDDHDRLVPVGAVGELVMGGPPVALGYLNDHDKTAEAFIAPPPWLTSLLSADQTSWRLYKTGDLVRYEIADGSLRYEGRKDRQIKVRGQRVELGDIEYHTLRCFPESTHAVIEQIMIPARKDPSELDQSSSKVPRIIACICGHEVPEDSTATEISETYGSDDILASFTPEFHADSARAVTRLREALPGYMIPDFFVPIRRVPRQKSGKTDRRMLREAISTGQAEFHRLDVPGAVEGKRYPRTDIESRLHAILVQHLKLGPEAVGIDDNLFYLGGDSIVAMKIAASARENGLDISPYDILRNPTVVGWADAVAGNESEEPDFKPLAAFSLLPEDERSEIINNLVAEGLCATEEDIQDILPAVDSQVYYVNSSSIVNFAEVFPTTLDPVRLQEACREVVSRYDILRTVFSQAHNRLFQVILRDVDPEFSVREVDDAEAFLTHESKSRPAATTPLNSLLTGFGLVKSTTKDTSALVVRISHAQYDGASLPFLWQAIQAAYQGDPLPEITPFSHMIHHRAGQEHDNTASFWRTYLQDSSPLSVDPLGVSHITAPTDDPNASRMARRELSQPAALSGATTATLVKAALSWVLSRHASMSDIILGQIAHGRGSPIPNVHQILGPCVTFLPIRIAIDAQQPVAEFLQHVQRQQVATVPHDSLPLAEIARQCTGWPQDIRFGCLVHHQALQSHEAFEMDKTPSFSSITWANSQPPPGQIDVISIERDTTLDLVLAAPPNVMGQEELDWLADRLSDTIGLFSKELDSPLATVAVV